MCDGKGEEEEADGCKMANAVFIFSRNWAFENFLRNERRTEEIARMVLERLALLGEG